VHNLVIGVTLGRPAIKEGLRPLGLAGRLTYDNTRNKVTSGDKITRMSFACGVMTRWDS
jgi:hypothetical protein